MAKQYSFDTYIEAGDYLKKRYPQNERLAALDVESAGIQFAEAYPDAVEVIEAKRKDDPRATFPYQPADTRGTRLLKTLGNVPYSAGMLAGDIVEAGLSPIQTAKGIGQTALGAAVSATMPGAYTEEGGVQRKPESVQMFETVKEGFKESLSDRGVQERPLDAISTALIAPGLLAKMGKIGLRAGAKATSPKMQRGVQPQVGAAMPEDRLEFPSGRRAGLSERLSQGAEIFERAEGAMQAMDPTVVMARGAKVATQRVGRAGVDASKRLAQRTARIPIDIGKAGAKKIDEILSGTSLGEWVREKSRSAAEKLGVQDLESVGDTALTKIQKAYGKGKEAALGVTEEVLGERPEMGFGPDGFFRGLLQHSLGFTFGIGYKAVKELIDVSTAGSKQLDVLLDTMRQGDDVIDGVQVTGDAIVSKRIIDDMNEAVRQYSDNQQQIHREMREPLQLNRVVVDIVPLRRQILDNLPGDVTLAPDGSVQFGPFFSETGQAKLRNAIESIFSVGNNAISLQQLDNFKGLIDELLYEGDLPPESRSASALRNMRGATRAYIGQIADDPVAMNAKLLDLRNADAQKMLRERAVIGGGMTGMVPESWLQQMTDEALGEFVPVNAGEYSAAMRQYFNYQDNMDRLRDQLRLDRPQTRTFDTGEKDPVTGQPVKEEVLRGRSKDIEVLRSVLGAFDEDTGLALETLQRLAVNTNRPELITQVVGALHRPALGGGLVVRSEISQAGRAAAGGVAHPIAMVMAGLKFLPSIALFSPRYGGEVVSYMFSPKGQQFLGPINAVMPYTPEGRRFLRGKGEDALNALRELAPEGVGFIRRHIAARKNKRPDQVTEQEMIVGLQDYMQIQDELAQADATQIKAVRDFYRYGTAQQRAEDAGGRREERHNLLARLGQPRPGQTGLTPSAR